MKEDKILCGTKTELLDYFYAITEPYNLICEDKTNMLHSKTGLEKQLNELQTKQKGFGMIFYMNRIVHEESNEVAIDIKLMRSYVHIKEEGIKY